MKPSRTPEFISRRFALMLKLGALLYPSIACSKSARRIKWSNLIPNELPYAEIIGNGYIDSNRDVWMPEFDANGSQFVTDLLGTRVTLAGYVLPLETGADGISEFVLVPYVGACIHIPPPPPNQLLFVESNIPFKGGNLWDAVLVTGVLSVNLRKTDLAVVGYEMRADSIEDYRA